MDCDYCCDKVAEYLCSGCSGKRYCSELCQERDWVLNGHVENCTLIGDVANPKQIKGTFDLVKVLRTIRSKKQPNGVKPGDLKFFSSELEKLEAYRSNLEITIQQEPLINFRFNPGIPPGFTVFAFTSSQFDIDRMNSIIDQVEEAYRDTLMLHYLLAHFVRGKIKLDKKKGIEIKDQSVAGGMLKSGLDITYNPKTGVLKSNLLENKKKSTVNGGIEQFSVVIERNIEFARTNSVIHVVNQPLVLLQDMVNVLVSKKIIRGKK